MKIRRFLELLFLATLFGCVGLTPVQADDEEETQTEESSGKKKKKKSKDSKKEDKEDKKDKKVKKADGESAVIQALSKFKVFNAKPNKKAEYFIYLYSASTCGHCQACMPIAAKEYSKMKSRKVELIVIDGDGSEKAAMKYLKEKRMRCPAIMFSALQATKFRGLPGCGMPGLPAISVVDKNGKGISGGSGVGAAQVQEILKNWRSITSGK